ncbi:MAG: helix-turn-helix domain-containing protein [Candidatus Marinimicrobia bacterium]|nr:helix-turn-helix domain-containing protein [Candidatus Neomarinimicrobiota bacterium]
MGQRENWSKSELDYLNERWGKSTLANLSIQLKRTKMAIVLKAKRMKFGAVTRADEYMTANQVSVLLNVDSHTVLRWIKKHNLKAERKILLFKKLFWLIKHCDLCKWLKSNQDRFDSRKIEFFGLGYEPSWLQKKRIKDKGLPKNRFKKWTDLEVQRIIIYSEDMKYKEIARLMDRSYVSIDHKINRLRCLSEEIILGV